MSRIKELADSVLGEGTLPGSKKGAFSLGTHTAFLDSFILEEEGNKNVVKLTVAIDTQHNLNCTF